MDDHSSGLTETLVHQNDTLLMQKHGGSEDGWRRTKQDFIC